MTKTELWKKYHRINEDSITERQCTTCGKWLEENTNNFYLMNKAHPKRGYSASCKRCLTEKEKERRHADIEKTRQNDLKYYYNNKDKCYQRMNRYRANNKDRIRDNTREWGRKNKDKLRKYGEKRKIKNHRVNEKEWQDCKAYFNNQCAYCGLPIEEHFYTRLGVTKQGDFHKEHVIDDGKNDLSNCIPSCGSCNSSKSTKTLNEFYNPNNPNYTYERYHKIYVWMRYDYKKYIKKKKRKGH